MSFGGSWNHSKVKDWQKLHNVGDDAAPKGSEIDREGDWQYNITQALAMRMNSIGIPRITEENIELVYVRSLMCDDVLGSILNKYDEDENGKLVVNPYSLTLDDIERRVGLWASTDKERPISDTAFKKKLADHIEHHAKRNSATARGDWRARSLIRSLKADDDWTAEHDAAAKRLGLDPDNYRLRDTGKCTFITGQAILDHFYEGKYAGVTA